MSQVLRSLAEQHEFNLRRWEELQADPEIRAWPGRVETDRDGNVIMTPPGGLGHGGRQGRCIALLGQYLPVGIPFGEFAVSTSDGNKIPDCGWVSLGHPEVQELLTGDLDLEEEPKVFTQAPEICVEVLSPRNSLEDIELKKRLYFETGAKEVWVCGRKGAMEFFGSKGKLSQSKLCPNFPSIISLAPSTPTEGGKDLGRGVRRRHECGRIPPAERRNRISKEKSGPER